MNQPLKPKKPSRYCPKCKSTSVAKILYGLVAMDDELERDLQLGRVYLGGCEDEAGAPNLHCNSCGHEFRVTRR